MSSTSQMQRIPHRIDEPAQQARVPFLRWTQRSDLDVPRIEQAVIARFLDDPLRRRNGEAGDDRFRAGRRGFDDAPGDADCTASGSIMPAESFFRITPRTKTSGFRRFSGARASKADASHEQGWKCALSCDRSRWFELNCLLERAELELQCGLQAALPGAVAHERSSRVGLVIRETRTPILRHQLASSTVSRSQRSIYSSRISPSPPKARTIPFCCHMLIGEARIALSLERRRSSFHAV